MKLKSYQERAIQKLLENSKDLLMQDEDKRLIFKSPTGSGKTIMMADFLRRLAKDAEILVPLAFIWTAPRKLHRQSKEKLERYFESTRVLECLEFEDLEDKQIHKNEILFFNWESINRTDNVYIRENERENNLGNVIKQTKNENRAVILIIDESHHHAKSETSQHLIRDIAPKLTIEVSATPIMESPDELVSVSLEDVKKEDMIKKSVILNDGFANQLKGKSVKSALANGSEEMVLKTAIKKREDLAKAYEAEGVRINPLVLIQLPDRKTQMEDQIKEGVIRILKDKHSITTENGKLAVYLSEEKENLENIAKNEHESEVLVFKQAISLGWDCPRAHILVLFRDWKSLTFSIQTVGRIMRMPNPDRGHYRHEALNHGYVYTNLGDIAIREDIARDYVTIYTSRRIEGYEPVKLVSCHSKRQREKTRLAPMFVGMFLRAADKYGLKHKIKTKGQKAQLAFITDYEAESVDRLGGVDISADKKIDASSGTELQKLFDFFARQNLSPFYPEDRSIGRVKESIYYFFQERLGMRYDDEFKSIVNIALSEANRRHFVNVLEDAKEHYKAETQRRESELEEVKEWDVPESVNYGGNYSPLKTKRSVMRPFFYDNAWRTEKAFIDFLEESNNINWWFKNGARDATFFAVPYEENGEWKPFYVDFVVRFKDGRIGLFDPKSGWTVEDARGKSDGLQQYIKKHAKKKNIFGGIVSNTNTRDFTGGWKVYTGAGADLVKDYFGNWDFLEI